MLCLRAALPFQANANYGTWSIDYGITTSYLWDFMLPKIMLSYLLKSTLSTVQYILITLIQNIHYTTSLLFNTKSNCFVNV